MPGDEQHGVQLGDVLEAVLFSYMLYMSSKTLWSTIHVQMRSLHITGLKMFVDKFPRGHRLAPQPAETN